MFLRDLYGKLGTALQRIDYQFAFTRRERRGFRVLLLFMTFTILVRAWGLVKPLKEWPASPEQRNAAEQLYRSGRAASGSGPETSDPNRSRRTHDSFPASRRYKPPSYMIKRKFIVDLNTADTFDLQELRGIGSVYARRIIAYRRKLGGFNRVEQLREVWGIDSLLFCRIRESVFVGPCELDRIDLNTATIPQLRNHPYLDYYQAKEIYLHRMKHGPFRNVEEVRFVNLIDSGTYKRVAPYLKAGNLSGNDTAGKRTSSRTDRRENLPVGNEEESPTGP